MPSTSNVDNDSFIQITGLSAGALNADLVPSTNVSGYKWLSLYIGPDVYSGLLSYHVSFDETNWIGCLLYDLTYLDGGNSTYTTSAQNIIGGMPIVAPYFRVRMTTYTSGNATAILQLQKDPPAGFQLLTTATRIMPAKNDIGFINNYGNGSAVIAAGTSTDTQVSLNPGMLSRILVTTAGTHEMVLYDNNAGASGTPVGIVPASTARGTWVECMAPLNLGLAVAGDSNNPGVSIFFAS
jgi:hypothetical protein